MLRANSGGLAQATLRQSLLALVGGGLCTAGSSQPANEVDTLAQRCSIRVGKNSQITDHHADGKKYVFESNLTVNPLDHKNIFVGVSAVDPSKSGTEVPGIGKAQRIQPESWFSKDGGRTWRKTVWPKIVIDDISSGNTVHMSLVFAGNGELLGTVDASDAAEESNDRTWVLHSKSGGDLWEGAVILNRVGSGFPRAFDRGNFGRDRTSGKYAGDVYISSLVAGALWQGKYQPRIRSWQSLWTIDRFIFDRAKVLPFSIDGPIVPNKEILIDSTGRVIQAFSAGYSVREMTRASVVATQWVVTSDDGGRSHSKPIPMRTVDGKPLISGELNVSMAVDASTGSNRDTIYQTWLVKPLPSSLDARWKLLFSRSKDGGYTWDIPRIIEELDNPGNVLMKGSYNIAPQALPIVSVNRHGIALLTWYRFSKDPQDPTGQHSFSYRRIVTASIDGGQTFLPPVWLAGHPQKPRLLKRAGPARTLSDVARP